MARPVAVRPTIMMPASSKCRFQAWIRGLKSGVTSPPSGSTAVRSALGQLSDPAPIPPAKPRKRAVPQLNATQHRHVRLLWCERISVSGLGTLSPSTKVDSPGSTLTGNDSVARRAMRRPRPVYSQLCRNSITGKKTYETDETDNLIPAARNIKVQTHIDAVRRCHPRNPGPILRVRPKPDSHRRMGRPAR